MRNPYYPIVTRERDFPYLGHENFIHVSRCLMKREANHDTSTTALLIRTINSFYLDQPDGILHLTPPKKQVNKYLTAYLIYPTKVFSTCPASTRASQWWRRSNGDHVRLSIRFDPGMRWYRRARRGKKVLGSLSLTSWEQLGKKA